MTPNSPPTLKEIEAACDRTASYIRIAPTVAQARPYGIYDLVHNQGHVYGGTSGDTADFAVDAIERWCQRTARPRLADERKVLILCDAGGSRSGSSPGPPYIFA